MKVLDLNERNERGGWKPCGVTRLNLDLLFCSFHGKKGYVKSYKNVKIIMLYRVLWQLSFQNQAADNIYPGPEHVGSMLFMTFWNALE